MRQKLLLLVSILVLTTWNTFSENLNYFNYTLQIRVDGKVLFNEINKDIVVTIYKADKVTAVFSEIIYNVSTNSVGICKLKIGSGVPIFNGTTVRFNALDWNYSFYTIGFKWDGRLVRSGNKSTFKISPYAISANLATYVDTLRSKLTDTIIVTDDILMSKKNILDLNNLKFKNSEVIENNIDGQIRISADSIYISGILKIDSLKSSTSEDIIVAKGFDLTNNSISGIKVLEINSATKTISGITTIGEVDLTTGVFASPLYLTSDGIYKLSNNTVLNKSRCVALSTNSESTNIQPLLLHGYIKKENWDFNKGDLIYINKSEISNIKPTTTDQFVQQIGYAVDTNIIYFDPQEVKKIISVVYVSPSIMQFVKINEKSAPLTVSEAPSAQSRKWYYGTSENGPYDQYLPDNDNEMSIQIGFGSINIYFVVCKSTYQGNVIVTSNAVKVFCGQNTITPTDNQTLKSNSISTTQLTISTTPEATAYQWVYDINENGTFSNEILNSTSKTFTPIFKNNGNYYVKCRATINNLYTYSNTVKIFVYDVSLTPGKEQFVNLGDNIKKISVSDVSSAKRLWLYSSNIDGPFVNGVEGTAGGHQFITTNGLPEGVSYVICESDGTPSNPIKITVVKNSISPILQFSAKTPNILTLDFGTTVPDSWVWYSGIDKSNITTPLQSSETQTPLSMNLNDSLFYYVKATYGTNVITSDIASVYSGFEIISPKKMLINRYKTDTVMVEYLLGFDNFRWYKIGSQTDLLNTLIDKSKFIPIKSTEIVKGQRYKVYCLANYKGITVSSDTIDIAVTSFRINNTSKKTFSTIGWYGGAIYVTDIQLSYLSLKWYGIENSVTFEINENERVERIEQMSMIRSAGEYKIYCELTFPEGKMSTDTIELVVYDLSLTPKHSQVLFEDELSEEIKLLFPFPAGAKYEWFVKNVSQGLSETLSPRIFPVNSYAYYVYCKIYYDGKTYDSNKVPVISEKIRLRNPEKHIFVFKDSTHTFRSSMTSYQPLSYSVKTSKNEIVELGSTDSYKFSNIGDYMFYITNKEHEKNDYYGTKIFKDSVKITVTNVFLNSDIEQFVQLKSTIDSLTVYTTLESPSYKWKYGTTENSITQDVLGGGASSKTLINFRYGVGTYYLKCEVTSGSTIQSSSVVKINILDNKIGPINHQTLEANTDGAKLTALYTLAYDSLRWYGGEAVRDYNRVYYRSVLIDNATDIEYIPNLGPQTWEVYCVYYYHNSSGVVEIRSNGVMITSVLTSIDAGVRYVEDMTKDGGSLILKESHPSTSFKWYYVKSPDGITMGPETFLDDEDRTYFIKKKFDRGYHYYVYAKSEYNYNGTTLIVESNKIDFIFPMVTITPDEDQPGVPINGVGKRLSLKIMPSDISTQLVHWFLDSDTTFIFLKSPTRDRNENSIIPILPNKPGALAYFAVAVFNGIEIRSKNYVCVGSSRKNTVPYLKDGAYVYGESFYPRAGVPNNPTFCGIPSTPVPAGLYWVDPDGYGGNDPIKAYCDGTWTSLGQEPNTAFTNCGAGGRYGPPQDSITESYKDNGLMSGAYNVVTNGNTPSVAYCGIQNWTIPTNGTYWIDIYGSRGSGQTTQGRGKGARIQGRFNFVKDGVLKIIVGQFVKINPPSISGGGGGGSFVSYNNVLKIAAGGGGGSSKNLANPISNPHDYRHGQDVEGSVSPRGGAVLGQGGIIFSAENYGGGGGGWNGDGGSVNNINCGYGGIRNNFSAFGGGYQNSSQYSGNHYGGFGGGGGNGFAVGGGGGGYTGGAGGFNSQSVKYYAGGGGSYNKGMTTDGYIKTSDKGVNDDMGKVIIKYKVH